MWKKFCKIPPVQQTSDSAREMFTIDKHSSLFVKWSKKSLSSVFGVCSFTQETICSFSIHFDPEFSMKKRLWLSFSGAGTTIMPQWNSTFFTFSLIKEGATERFFKIFYATEVSIKQKLWFHQTKMYF